MILCIVCCRRPKILSLFSDWLLEPWISLTIKKETYYRKKIWQLWCCFKEVDKYRMCPIQTFSLPKYCTLICSFYYIRHSLQTSVDRITIFYRTIHTHTSAGSTKQTRRTRRIAQITKESWFTCWKNIYKWYLRIRSPNSKNKIS